ncbi:FTR1 family protein [Mucilaginibacter sp.]|jgi:high-affinity iron transporter|uniref:FTR1 family protein n=1 Tax=Mucilaginibacter sp. TaxID=1882438 RepID=UPI002C82313F|nr:FTR1 family protein [Mucilaginibacter sp.]HTI59010.1 FTR1 family protein [Mucilaginibacter sp.]
MKIFQLSVSFVLLLLLLPAPPAIAKEDDHTVQTIIHLLDYISGDYPAAVQNHRIKSREEYSEMLEFSTAVTRMCGELTGEKHIQSELFLNSAKRLNRMIREKNSPGSVGILARSVKEAVIKATGYKVSPESWPDLSAGQVIYMQKCASCHGSAGAGDGPLASSLRPVPANFLNDSIMKRFTSLRAYNTISLGVRGTAMRGFKELPPDKAWSVAFYIQSLRFKKLKLNKARSDALYHAAMAGVNLKDASNLTDSELIDKMNGGLELRKEKLAAIRLHIPDKEAVRPLQSAKTYLLAALQEYQGDNVPDARQKALEAYLEGIEPLEAQLSTSDANLTTRLEQQMLKVRSLIESHRPKPEVSREINDALSLIAEADSILNNTKVSFWLAFVLSASILLREGMEAFLIIAIMISIIQSTGKKKALLWLHGGWITALLAGLAGWYLTDLILKISGQSREMLEGFISLFAVCVLIYVGFWLHRNSDVKKWKSFVEKKINRLLNKENMFGLAAFAFLVVFREAFESILFLKAIELEVDPRSRASIGLGVLTALTLIFFIAFIWIRYAQRIPIRQLFKYGSAMIAVLVIVIIGKGIHSLQESGLFTVHPFHFNITSDLLGIYPTMETMLAQGVLLCFIVGLGFLRRQKLKQNIRVS